MRITDLNQFILIRQQLQAGKEKIARANAQITTGKLIDGIGDDPAVVQKTLRNARDEADLEQYGSNLQDQADRYKTYDSQIGTVYDMLSELKSSMMQMTSPYPEADARQVMQAKLDQIRAQLMGLANSQRNGQYMFSGGRTGTAPIDGNGDYQGDSLELSVDILPGVTMEQNITGEKLFTGAGAANGVNIFKVIADMQTQLAADPQEAMRSHLDQVGQAISQAVEERARVGVRLSQVQQSQSTLDQLKADLTGRRGADEDADYATAITEFQAQQYALEAALQTNGRLLTKSLLDYLG